ncbi:MAG: hypothetical protein H6730_18125 [Deltaproteobacteria bacterium]|nr:hypothetical protein [Deltaproteobacteria bacterium]
MMLLETIIVVGSINSTASLPIDWAAIQRSSVAWPGLQAELSPLGAPASLFGEGSADLMEALAPLPEAQKARLGQYIDAHRDEFGPTIDTPQELRQLLQQLNQGEGRAQGLPALGQGQAEQGQGFPGLNGMSAADMLQMLIDYLMNGGGQNQGQQSPPRYAGNLGGGGGGGGGRAPAGASGPGRSGGTSAAAPTGPATDTSSLRGNTNAERAFNYFVDKGLSPAQAAGIVGNLQAESGVKPGQHQIGGPAFGIAQWEGPRREALEQFARAQGKPVDDLGVQLDFIWHECQTTERGAFEALKQTRTPAEAAQVWCSRWERAGIPHMENRIAYANEALGTFA